MEYERDFLPLSVNVFVWSQESIVRGNVRKLFSSNVPKGCVCYLPKSSIVMCGENKLPDFCVVDPYIDHFRLLLLGTQMASISEKNPFLK